MAKTVVDQPTIINGMNFPTYPCKHEDECKNYNPAKTLTNSHGVVYLNKCTHGGGAGHACFRLQETIRYNEPYQKEPLRRLF